MPDYNDFSPIADKVLRSDGSIETFAGDLIREASEKGLSEYENRAPIADKMIEPDGTITTLSSLISGGDDVSDYRGIIKWCADTMDTFETVIATLNSANMIVGDLFDVVNDSTYSWNGSDPTQTSSWVAVDDSSAGDKPGMYYEIESYYGQYQGNTYHGDANGRVICRTDTPNWVWDYIIRPSFSIIFASDQTEGLSLSQQYPNDLIVWSEATT
jgi:hypothetical protein